MVEASAAVLAWLGGALIVLSDGRRGLALGMAEAAVGLSSLAWAGGEKVGAAAILAGGLIASAQLLRSSSGDWGIMTPGSTPRLILCVAAALLALWVGASVTSGPGAQLRVAVLAVIWLMGARVLTGRDSQAVLTAIVALALTMAAAAGLAGTSPGPAPYILGALIAGSVVLVPVVESHAA